MIRFEVEYQINSAEWERSAQRRREAWAIPVVHAFLGDLNLGVADSRVFTSGLHTSIADFACQSAIRLGNGVPLSREGWGFEELDGARHINFMLADKLIQVTSDVSGSASLDVPANSVRSASMRSYLSSLGTCASGSQTRLSGRISVSSADSLERCSPIALDPAYPRR